MTYLGYSRTGRPVQMTVPTNEQGPLMPLRMQVTWQVLKVAKEMDDQTMIAICRRIITANRIGWKTHGRRSDLIAVLDYAERMGA